jgi:hypothetical protein
MPVVNPNGFNLYSDVDQGSLSEGTIGNCSPAGSKCRASILVTIYVLQKPVDQQPSHVKE